ncbi:TetR/AcrR family transcriptional regulator [Glycomyces tarimensis]
MAVDTAEPRMTRAAHRILDAASELFYHRGITSVGVDLIAAEAGVTKKTIYDRFGSKDKLVIAYLKARDVRWRAVVEQHIAAAPGSREAVVAVFDSLGEWRATEGGRGCAMINARAELTEPDHPSRELAGDQKRWLQVRFAELLTAAGMGEVEELAVELLLLHEGAVVVSDVGELERAVAVARCGAARLVGLG